jgi:hypothetical protein
MEGKFTHYLVTRFNVRIDGYGPEFIDPAVRTATWEQERLPLFEHFCAPTVSAQRSSNFTWLIYCDASTDPDIIYQIRRIVHAVPAVELLFVDHYTDMIAHLKHRCAEARTPFVITSRLDNDDGLGRDYIFKVQEHFEPSGNVVINLSGGVIYNMEAGLLTHLHQSLNNSFISLIEEVQSADELITVYGFRHLAPPSMVRVKNIPHPYAFWMNLHKKNAGPRFNRGRPSWPVCIARHYAIQLKYFPVSISSTITYSMRWLPNALKNRWRSIASSRP